MIIDPKNRRLKEFLQYKYMHKKYHSTMAKVKPKGI